MEAHSSSFHSSSSVTHVYSFFCFYCFLISCTTPLPLLRPCPCVCVEQGMVGLVTGGASGLGRATVERLVQNGAAAVILDLPSSDGAALAATLGDRCAFAPADVSPKETCRTQLIWPFSTDQSL